VGGRRESLREGGGKEWRRRVGDERREMRKEEKMENRVITLS